MVRLGGRGYSKTTLTLLPGDGTFRVEIKGTTQFTRQAILWRLLLTGLILLILVGSSLTIFGTVTTSPETQVLPTLSREVQGGILNLEER